MTLRTSNQQPYYAQSKHNFSQQNIHPMLAINVFRSLFCTTKYLKLPSVANKYKKITGTIWQLTELYYRIAGNSVGNNNY